jgi:hypothetical protein
MGMPAVLRFRFRPLILVSLLCPIAPALGQGNGVSPPVQWQRDMGVSGLRKFYSTGSDLGELVNRSVSYRIAQSIAARGGTRGDIRTDVDNYVGHFDSLIAIQPGTTQPLRLRALARLARRDQSGRMTSSNDRIDLGILYAPAARSFLGIGLAAEWTDVDLEFVTARTEGRALGPRLDAGVVLGDRWALGARIEELRFSGSQTTFLPGADGAAGIRRSIDSERRFLKVEGIKRLDVERIGLSRARTQLHWRSGLYHLSTSYADQVDSTGRPVLEPFGKKERLSTLRSGIQLSQNFSARWQGSFEVLWDYEFDTDMSAAIDDPHTLMVRTGIGRTLAPGQRINLEHHRAQSQHRDRVRDLFIVIAVIDF